ncbi:adenine deaminase [Bacillus aquiflavi]|uniref:adenine deaminase n=1 Tax=Bacillus aquiflavi TaxID=2672567 RepID=A0A6B3VWG0_9BACI|nr:adenine deaminase C-terminal domain-containing protein [Bacillus aquiflavi]MBA4538241.1 adenine deaminase [Bacillus aquiflavi]NEY82560.1 adenine deaminase [Bacillus aquiflavi]
MLEQRYRWKNKELRNHVAVIDGKLAPTILLKNATYLNQTFHQWMTAHIWIYEDRIIYVGEKVPDKIGQCEVIDCKDTVLVPGYIEPHSHPFQLYNPHSFARYASKFGTTTLINDNLMLALLLDKKKAFSFLRKMKEIPPAMYWWSRFDSQTELHNEEIIFSNSNVKKWLEHDAVLQGGELTGWPRLLQGDDMMLHWIQEAKRMRKKIEGHFPGASEKTLTKMMLLGTDCDHEAMTGVEVYNRLMQGYTVSLRHSSIRPDLPQLLDDIHSLGIAAYDKFIMTTDGSSSSFYEDGVIDKMIRIAIEKGVPLIDAYNMGTINTARYYQIDHLLGNIATGRIANINFLESKENPTPVSVMASGKWLTKDGKEVGEFPKIDWGRYGFNPLEINWSLTSEDMQFSMPFGLKMENSVIIKPYSVSTDVAVESLDYSHDECFFMLINREGKWRINTLLKGFATKLDGLASSFSNTGDFILIGKNKSAMVNAFNRMKEIGGGIVIAESDKIIHEIPLALKGMMSDSRVETLIKQEKQLMSILKARGYMFADPIYTLLFFSSTHLPYIRATQQGLFDVMNKIILFPSIMR